MVGLVVTTVAALSYSAPLAPSRSAALAFGTHANRHATRERNLARKAIISNLLQEGSVRTCTPIMSANEDAARRAFLANSAPSWGTPDTAPSWGSGEVTTVAASPGNNAPGRSDLEALWPRRP